MRKVFLQLGTLALTISRRLIDHQKKRQPTRLWSNAWFPMFCSTRQYGLQYRTRHSVQPIEVDFEASHLKASIVHSITA